MLYPVTERLNYRAADIERAASHPISPSRYYVTGLDPQRWLSLCLSAVLHLFHNLKGKFGSLLFGFSGFGVAAHFLCHTWSAYK